MHSTLCVLQEVSGLKCEQLLSSGQVLPSECVSGLVELVGNPNTSPTLSSSIISLLAQLGNIHLHIRTFKNTTHVAYFLHNPSIFFPSPCIHPPSACDDDSRELLHSSYNLTSTLASVIHCHSATPKEPLVLQVCPLLLMATTNHDFNNQSIKCHKMLKNINQTTSSNVLICLYLLS